MGRNEGRWQEVTRQTMGDEVEKVAECRASGRSVLGHGFSSPGARGRSCSFCSEDGKRFPRRSQMLD